MLFDWLKEHYGIKVKYEIVEAKDEVGGRLFTYKFPVKGDDNGHQYCKQSSEWALETSTC